MSRHLGYAIALLSGTLLSGSLCAAAPGMNDPNIWLEDVSSPKALAWVENENTRTLGILEGDPHYAGFYADALRIAEASDKIPMPELIGGAVTNFWQDADHVHGIWRTTSPTSYATPTPEWRTLLDLDALSVADKANWVWHGVDCEPLAEQRCLVKLSDGGEDADTEREFDLVSQRFVPGGFTLPLSKQSAAWEDGDTLLVARDWGAGTLTASGYPFVVKRLRRGQPLAAATEVFRGRPDDVQVNTVTYADASGRRIAVIMRGVTFFESQYLRVTPTGTVPIDVPPKTDLMGFVDGLLVFRVNQDWTPKGRTPIGAGALIAVDPAGMAPPETIFLPNPRQSVDAAMVSGDRVIASIYDNVRGRAVSFARTSHGWAGSPVALPDNAAVDLVSAERTGSRTFISTESFLLPTTVSELDAATGVARSVKTTPARFDAARLVTEQFEAVSTDGTRVPYFIVRRRDVPSNGSMPTLMTAYGGFQVSSTPFYSGARGKLWLARGGAFVLANIRGGGEFGPAWHEAALKTKRQVAYDDFAAVAKDLIRRGLTSPRRLGIYGGSNGGLLMGVEMTQHPDLWNAVAIEVPLLDMLRYEQLSAGSSWVGEYGSMSVPAERVFWERVSPYQALKPNVAYPEPFIWTTTKDDRVGPAQARKFAARMKSLGLPYLYWENTAGGHGSGSNLKERARASALEMVYFTRRLMDPQSPDDPR